MTDQVEHEGLAATYTVSELCGDVRGVFKEAFDSFWVVGEVQRVRPNRNGHLFFELIEKGGADEVVGKLDAVIWRRDHEQIKRVLAAADQEIAEGRQMRCRASLDFYAPYGRTQLVVREIDVVFALGELAARRRETLQALTQARLLELNGQLQLSEHPLDIALVTSRDSAAYHDFLETLRESGLGFRISLFDAAMQGKAAEGSISSALAAASRLRVDACVLIRGGGSRTDLAAFDSRRVAEGVARSKVPVLTGLGHQIDDSIADRVAHTALKTPTKVAEYLVERVTAADRTRLQLERELVIAIERRLAGALDKQRSAEGRTLVARQRLNAAQMRVNELGRFLGRTARRLPAAALQAIERTERELGKRAPRALARRREGVHRLAKSLERAGRGRLQTAQEMLAGKQRLVLQLGPEQVLARGFSITRDSAGRALRRADEIGYGQVLNTQLAHGAIKSRVENE